MPTYYDYALLVARKAFARTFHAYFARPESLTEAHDEQLYQLARACGHCAIRRDSTLAPGEPMRY